MMKNMFYVYGIKKLNQTIMSLLIVFRCPSMAQVADFPLHSESFPTFFKLELFIPYLLGMPIFLGGLIFISFIFLMRKTTLVSIAFSIFSLFGRVARPLVSFALQACQFILSLTHHELYVTSFLSESERLPHPTLLGKVYLRCNCRRFCRSSAMIPLPSPRVTISSMYPYRRVTIPLKGCKSNP